VPARINVLPRAVVLALALPVALLLAWRVLVAGTGALAERNLETGGPVAGAPPDAAAAEAQMRQRLARNPADATAILLLAIELERQGKRDEADAAMRTAVRLAPADPPTLLLVAGYFLRTGEEAQALTALRRAVDSSQAVVGDRVWPVFSTALATGRHRKFFDDLARDNPSWWPVFFRYACTGASNAGAVQEVYATRVAADVATPDERRCLIDRLQRDGQWTGAYLVWLNGLPLEQRQRVGYVFNGGFELPLSNSGFDWRIPAQDGVVVSAEPGDGTGSALALSVTFANQRYAGPPVYQHLLLAPGRYRLEGRARSDLNAWLGLQWGLYCQGGAGRETKQLAHSQPFAGSTRWREFGEDFAVPKNCPAQVLRLELANPKQGANAPGNVAIRLKGKVWFDDMRVRIVD
jgi:hypothetical protein